MGEEIGDCKGHTSEPTNSKCLFLPTNESVMLSQTLAKGETINEVPPGCPTVEEVKPVEAVGENKA